MKRPLIAALLAMVATCGGTAAAQTYNFTTLAGKPSTQGSADGVGSAARFYYPYGAVSDEQGNIYVADTYNYTIRRIATNGVVATIAGKAGSQGDADGGAAVTRFFFPAGIVMDAQGILFVGDGGAIRRVTSGGLVTTFAGMVGVVGDMDGTGAEARFHGSQGLAFDRAGNLYLADTGNHKVRKITTNAVVTTVAGPTGLVDPRGVAVDASGNIYVADGSGDTIQKVTPDGTVSSFAGKLYTPGSKDGAGSAARFDDPEGLAIDSAGNLYVSDTGSSVIRKITPDGVVTTIGGKAYTNGYTDGVGSSAAFLAPHGLSVDKVGNIFIPDFGNELIRKGTPIPPSMQIYSAGPRLAVAWPSWASNFVFEASASVTTTNSWLSITNGISSDTNNLMYAFPPTNSAQFFRLRSP